MQECNKRYKMILEKITAWINNAQQVEREGDIEIHEQKIYHAFYNTNLSLSDSEIAKSLENVGKRLKMGFTAKKTREGTCVLG